MANKSEIRLQIVTALDAAGIKATKQQIDAMTSSVMDSNRKMGKSANEMAAAFGRIRGPVGKLTGAFGNLGGSLGKAVGVAGMFVGALETGIAVGTKIWEGLEHIRKEWLKIKTVSEEVVEANKRRAKEAERMDALLTKEAERTRELAQLDAERAKEAIENIKAEAEAYRVAARAKFEYQTAGMDVEYQRLEREKFEDILALQANGYDGAAVQQVEAIYDVLKAELDIKKQMAKIDAEEEKALIHRREMEERRAASEERYGAAFERVVRARNELEAAENWWWFDEKGNPVKGYSEKAQERRVKRAKRELRDAERELDAADKAQFEAGNALRADNTDAVFAMKRATALDAANLARDRAAAAYDRATANGDALGLQFGEGYIQYLRQSTEQSYRALLEIQKNTADYDEALNKLLTMRGGE